ncbi:MAG: ATP-dependent DNA helicase DinG, partial [Pseudomonadales bacterium]
VEAGTGTGKTIAYTLAAIPVARAYKKTIVIATATIALQEQIVYQDLPDILKHSGLEFSFVLAKGRRRYLCLSKLDQAMQKGSSKNLSLALYDEQADQREADPSDEEVFNAMLARLGKGEWDGDKDNWPHELNDRTWRRVSTDHVQCTGQRCARYNDCIFYKARENVKQVECVVTNHDLVLADLMMGGGAVLPAPEDTIYIFDEGHHLPEKAASHFSHFLEFHSMRTWLAQQPARITAAVADLSMEGATIAPKVEDHIAEISAMMDSAAQLLVQFQQQADKDGDGFRYRFPLGQVPDEVASVARDLALGCERLCGDLQSFEAKVKERLDEELGEGRQTAEAVAGAVSAMVSRLQDATGLWRSYGEEVAPDTSPSARWINFRPGGASESMEMQLSSCPISVADDLVESLWSRSFGVVITSATLSVAKDFSIYRLRTGLDEENRFVSLPSPFYFPEQGVLRIPKMRAEPNQVEEHTQAIVDMLPELLADDIGSLVLFTSRRQMRQVEEGLDAAFRERLLCQDSLPKMEIIKRHKASVDSGEPSCIFGLTSFAEGIDLPGDYCTHVVIAKIPFAVPDEPVIATHQEWLKSQGRNAFQEINLPEAALRMVQMAGRLLRTETDTGQVTVLDRRLLTKAYGETLLAAMPPFKLERE